MPYVTVVQLAVLDDSEV